jgi:ABC-type multidrug transport system fused ATPase/permease subunit
MKIPLKQYWNLLVDYLRPQWPRVLLLTVLLMSAIGLQLINPQNMRRFIDAATQMASSDVDSAARTAELRSSALLFIGLALLQQITNVLATYLSAMVGWRATNALRVDLADHCLRLDMSFHNARTPGEMIERLDGDVRALTNFFSQFVIQVFGSGLLLIGVLVLLYREDWRVGAAFTAFAIVAVAAMTKFRNIAVPHWEAARQASAELFGFIEERLAGTEDIRASGARAYVMSLFYRLMRALYRKSLKAGLMVNIMINATSLSFSIGSAVAFAVGAYLYRGDLLSIGTVYLIFYYSRLMMWPIMRLTRQLEDLQRAGAGIARIEDLFAVQSKIEESVDGQPLLYEADGQQRPSFVQAPLADGPLAVQFERVSFGYDDARPDDGAEDERERTNGGGASEGTGEQPAAESAEQEKQMVLHNLSFTLNPGDVLGLLGRTGSGKTTLTRLLFRLYDVDSGAIRLGTTSAPGTMLGDGMADIRQLSLLDLRRSVGMVTQNIQLFHATVRDNLTFFAPRNGSKNGTQSGPACPVPDCVSDDDILGVIDELGLGEWFRALPKGLDTVLESGGGGLSAGEAQLLAFTRIFLQDPGLVILDEASSRLDPATERLIERAVDRLVRERTAIIIAHRLHTVQRADEIMILENGHIQEYGVRSALARDRGSRFYSLLQTGLEEVLA